MKISGNLNISLYLLLPLVDTDKTKENDFFKGKEEALINGYLTDINKPYLDNHINIVFENLKFKERELESFYKDPAFERVAHYQIGNIWVKSYALRLSEKYSLSIKKIIDGEAYLITNKMKEKIIEFWDASANSIIFKILYKNEKYSIREDILPETEDPQFLPLKALYVR